MEEKAAALAELLRQTRHAHHQAYLATNGADPDWPTWYADYLVDNLPSHLGVRLNKEDIANFLVLLDDQHKSQSPGADWTQFYARAFLLLYPV
jgi:hypothetical protein